MNLPRLQPLSFLLALQLSGLPMAAVAQASPPVIVHEQVKVAARGQAKTIIARVSVASGSIQTVNLYVTQSADASPLKIEMKPSGAPGTYYGTIPATYLQSKGTLRYYIEAISSDAEWKETNWMSLAVQDPGELPPEANPVAAGNGGGATVPPPGESGKPAWFWPTVLIGGGALAVAGAVALADSGGGSDPAPPPDDGDLAGRIITRTVRDDAELANHVLPKDTVIDVSSSLNGRTVESVRVDLTLDAADTFADEVQVLYNGATVLETGPVVTSVTRSVTLSGTSPVVTLRVAKSALDDNGFQNYSLTATVTYILKKQ